MTASRKKILVLAIRAIGDVVLITPLLPVIKQRFPGSYLAVLVDGASAQVLQHNPHISRLIVIDRSVSRRLPWLRSLKEWFRLLSGLRREHFDIVVDLFSGPRTAVLAWACGASDRYAEDFRSGIRGFLYNHPTRVRRDTQHLVEQKLELVQPLVGKVEQGQACLEVYLTEPERRRSQMTLSGFDSGRRRFVGLVPGAGSAWRMWPAERFAQVGDRLARDYSAEILILGGPQDFPVCQRVCASMTAKPVDLSGKTTLRELIAILAELDLVVSNVTGPMHLASALPKPKVIGLYGAADTVQYAPWGPHATMITKGKPQEAYWKNVDYQRDYNILLQIRVHDVLAAVQLVMNEWTQARVEFSRCGSHPGK